MHLYKCREPGNEAIYQHAWFVAILPAPSVLNDDIVHPHSTQDGMDLRRRLAAEDGVDMLCAIPEDITRTRHGVGHNTHTAWSGT